MMVEAGTDARVLRPEAALQHHLSIEHNKTAADRTARGAKPTEKMTAGPVTAKTASVALKPAATAKADGKDGAAKDAKKEDLQLSAALNHLKGLPITATTTAAVTVK